ncbi:MAG: class I SAM-dependent methyltransferase [Candidatus Vogelbacteria bacterium]|nr:class I SAM-dependent methyltransferase [Candidatus Vogelbacteria bacterium]
MKNSTAQIYEYHHSTARAEDFSILKEARGKLFKFLVGQNKMVLDIGCRDGALTSFFVEGNKVLGVDVDSISLLRAKERLNIETTILDLHGNWAEISGRSFDCVVAGEVLEHVYYPEEVIKKVRGHLNSGGVFIGSVPNPFNFKNRLRYLLGSKKGTPLSDPTHINHFHINELRSVLGKYFSKVEIIGLGRWVKLARWFPGWCSFDLVFVARD